MFGRPQQHSCVVMFVQRHGWGISTPGRNRHHLIYHNLCPLEMIGGTLSHQTGSITYVENINALMPTSKAFPEQSKEPLYIRVSRRNQTKCFFLHIWTCKSKVTPICFDLAKRTFHTSTRYFLQIHSQLFFFKLC